MTANAMVGDREAVIAAGMNDHIAKPIVVDEMFATLAKWVKPVRSPGSGNGGPPVDGAVALSRIDTNCGLANTGGDDEFYRRMLGRFLEREADFVQRFRTAHAAFDAATARRAAHDLKSAAGTLGMHSLEEAAAALEQDCSGNVHDFHIDERVLAVANRLDEVIGELRSLGTSRIP